MSTENLAGYYDRATETRDVRQWLVDYANSLTELVEEVLVCAPKAAESLRRRRDAIKAYLRETQ